MKTKKGIAMKVKNLFGLASSLGKRIATEGYINKAVSSQKKEKNITAENMKNLRMETLEVFLSSLFNLEARYKQRIMEKFVIALPGRLNMATMHSNPGEAR